MYAEITEEEELEVTRMTLMAYRRPSVRTWQRFDRVKQDWVSAHWYEVLRFIKAQTILVTKTDLRPEHKYKELYSRIGFLAQPGIRMRWFKEEFPDITLND